MNGAWLSVQSGNTRDIIHPSNQKVVATIAEGGDENLAIAAAREAFDNGEWKETTGVGPTLHIAVLIERDYEELAELETLDTGRQWKRAARI